MLDLIANTSTEKKIYQVLNPMILSNGLRIVKIKFQRGKEFKLLIFLDKIDGKITVDECSDLSVVINSLLDIEGIIKNPYRLEVSSAGIDRYLSSSDDFLKYQNYKVMVKSQNFTVRGKLVNYTPNSLTLLNKNGATNLDLSSVIDVKIDLEGMSLENIKQMEFI